MNNKCHKANGNELLRVFRRDLIDRIAIGIAHEIRNPLTVVKGYLQLQAKKSAYRSESQEIVLQELLRIEALVDNIVSLAHSKALQKNPENLNDILAGIYPLIQNIARKKGITTELKLDDSLPLLDLHAGEIEQLILNLASNGIEAMPGKGKLTIGVSRRTSNVLLYVQDKGSGIPASQIEQIFDPFFTTKAGNTGLGLAVSLNIVERHQGEIEIASTMGVGSIFKILFPITAKSE
ncbi:nitrogen regulation protein NR(II) [Sporomusa aerivorans]|uniref:two-component system sensor histidine kinase NtrB n=1 Tax=Sporomusa aerivorans TaxID=204936 RepID=UPI00352A804A